MTVEMLPKVITESLATKIFLKVLAYAESI